MMEPFTVIEEQPEQRLNDKFEELTSGKTADHDIQYQAALRERYSELTLTAVPANNCNLLAFAGAGHAQVELDTTVDPAFSWRGWLPSYGRSGTATIGQTVFFAKYHLQWRNEDFILYVVGGVQYILKEPRGAETVLTPSRVTDELIEAVGVWQTSDNDIVWVFDNYWRQDKALWEQVAKAKWDNVILDENMKKDLTSVSNKFFDNEAVYKDLGVPWKRGIIFHGPAGNGKTISIKALMHTLHDRKKPIQSLYVKQAPNTYAIGQIFSFARSCAPCMLIFEDIETIITNLTRSYFLNEVDGLESNDGILMVASTNFLERLDPGITKRPSRFDRKYLFPLPNQHERTLYAEYWRNKVTAKDSQKVKIDFPEKLCGAMASITNEFSFAYMQEAFVATLLNIVREEADVPAPTTMPGQPSFRPGYMRSAASQALYNNLNPANMYMRDPLADLEQYRIFRIFREQVNVLRGDMDKSESATSSPPPSFRTASIPSIKSTSPPHIPTLYTTPNDPSGTTTNRDLALQDYQMQLMLLEQQNKKRLLQSRQEADDREMEQRHKFMTAANQQTFSEGLPSALSMLRLGGSTKPEFKVKPTEELPSLPPRPMHTEMAPQHPTMMSRMAPPTTFGSPMAPQPTFDAPAEGAAGRKWPLINTTSLQWGPGR
ncbi:P-loop containing nucleoside triphosphate hydrolase protein [Elsinoe ampelina]|uniref:P-loop containing nucleoside triphosphate hydrolase protein n=1 Tax=Elsinoe ampelina TaxID=302913 RepID=A0A6A6G8S1_9PEZI|nr:P-loop containing nucleoside triphosphate hydrolase protein [Elsinoe ampelina]